MCREGLSVGSIDSFIGKKYTIQRMKYKGDTKDTHKNRSGWKKAVKKLLHI